VADTLNTPDPKPTSSVQSEPQITGFVFDIKRYAIHDGPGIRTTVFFKGCPLHCQWCQNPESWDKHPELGFRTGRCVRCGQCVEVCTSHATTFIDDQPSTDPGKCSLCGECVDACLAGAREIIGREMTVVEVMERHCFLRPVRRRCHVLRRRALNAAGLSACPAGSVQNA